MKKSLTTKEYEVFIELLWQARIDADVTQVELAKRLKWKQGFVSKCENMDRRLDIIEARTWLKVLGVSFADFAKKLEKKLGR